MRKIKGMIDGEADVLLAAFGPKISIHKSRVNLMVCLTIRAILLVSGSQVM
jgi:hypothetical protein